jgi:diguanylate cyclase (GGDEF)-like protein
MTNEHAATAASTSKQGRLDALVTQIAAAFMPVSGANLREALDDALRVMVEFFDVNVSFLRHNDFENGMSVLVAEWPPREDVPDPDPLGVVPFDADPVFAAIRTLDSPFVMRPNDPGDDPYQERVEAGSGVEQVSLAMVPLIVRDATHGVLGFVKFGDREWDVAETNALQAVASLIVQLEARVEAEERLVHQAMHDELTGLPNRRAFLVELDDRLHSSESTAVVFLDLDRFKAMNDALGHAAGDSLLVTVAERLSRGLRPGDTVARFSADEFVILLRNNGSGIAAMAAAERLLDHISEPIDIGGHQIVRTASAGVAIGRHRSVSPDELLAQADVARRVAKQGGGNQPVLFDSSLRAKQRERTNMELELRDALVNGELRLHYQPEIDLRTGELLAVEALVRWEHPEKGLLNAGTFITVAEESGLIVDLGRWVLAEACRQRAEWRQAHPWLDFTVRINLSPAQLTTRNIVRIVEENLRANELPGRFVCFEITEHAVMADVEHSVARLHELKALGVTLAIDDFGTGFSSMAQLKRLPVDILKIDQTFVAGLGVDGGDHAIVDATLRLARSFGLDVVAEGIEVQEQADILSGLGCVRGQGFLLARPASAEALETVLRAGRIDLGGMGQHSFATFEHGESDAAPPATPTEPSESPVSA